MQEQVCKGVVNDAFVLVKLTRRGRRKFVMTGSVRAVENWTLQAIVCREVATTGPVNRKLCSLSVANPGCRHQEAGMDNKQHGWYEEQTQRTQHSSRTGGLRLRKLSDRGFVVVVLLLDRMWLRCQGVWLQWKYGLPGAELQCWWCWWRFQAFCILIRHAAALDVSRSVFSTCTRRTVIDDSLTKELEETGWTV